MQPVLKHIASRDNPIFKRLKRLAGSLRECRKANLILLEGPHLLTAWLTAQRSFDSEESALVVAESAWDKTEVRLLMGFVEPAFVMPDSLFALLADAKTPQGVLAFVPNPENQALLDFDRDTVLLDGVQDPGNLGTLLRTAAAAGFTQALLSTDCASPWSAKVLRSGQGAHFVMDIYEQQDLPAFAQAFKGISIATALQASADLYQTGAFDVTKSIAWVFGSEGAGVSEALLSAVNTTVKIPMSQQVDSLNVSAAAAICLFETQRQRKCHET